MEQRGPLVPVLVLGNRRTRLGAAGLVFAHVLLGEALKKKAMLPVGSWRHPEIPECDCADTL